MKTRENSSIKYKPLPELKELENLVGDFIQYWGFKKIHGRIWVHLYTSSEPLDSQTLMSRLKVSKGLISLAIRDLLKYEVIEVVSTGKHGVTFFKANPDLMAVITRVLTQREVIMISSAGSCLERITLKSKTDIENAKIDFEKVQNIKKMTESAHGLLSLFIIQAGISTDSENLNAFSSLTTQPNL